MLTRRSLFRGFSALIAAPAIVQVASIMPVSAAIDPRIEALLGERLDIHEIVLRTFRANQDAFIRNIEQHNALFRRFMDWEAGKIAAGTWLA